MPKLAPWKVVMLGSQDEQIRFVHAAVDIEKYVENAKCRMLNIRDYVVNASGALEQIPDLRGFGEICTKEDGSIVFRPSEGQALDASSGEWDLMGIVYGPDPGELTDEQISVHPFLKLVHDILEFYGFKEAPPSGEMNFF